MEVKRKRSSSQDDGGIKPAKIQRKSEKSERKKSKSLNKSTEEKKEKSLSKRSKFNSKFEKSSVKKPLKNGQSSEKPNWNEFKKKKKELRKKRKQQKCSVFDLTCKAKKLWEKMRRGDCKSEDRDKLSSEAHKLLKGNLEKVVYSHDLSRIIQWLLKVGPSDVKEDIVEELKDHVPTMLESKYACFCVKSMLKHGNVNSKRAIVNSLRGKVVKLASHSVAAPMFETIYSKWATGSERSLLQQEFYGDLYKHEKETNILKLEDAFESSPSMKGAILSAVKANVVHVLDKKLGKSSLLHSVLLEYLKFCSKEDQQEICQQIQESLLDFTSTKCGAHIAVICICQATNKTKKLIMKTLKGHMMDIAKLEYGHLVLLSLFDTVDDTVLLKKLLMPEILCDLWGLVNNEYGRKVILHIVAHRDPLYFHPSDISILEEGVKLSSSKKDMNVRIAEIKESVLPPLLEAISNDACSWMNNSSIEMVTLAVLKSGRGEEVKKAFESVAGYVCDPDGRIKVNEKDVCVAEHPGTHMMLKKLIQYDNERTKKGEVTFCSVLASKLSADILSSWIKCNRGCFILVFVLESGLDLVVEEVLKKLEHLKHHIKKETSPGGKILYKKLIENCSNVDLSS